MNEDALKEAAAAEAAPEADEVETVETAVAGAPLAGEEVEDAAAEPSLAELLEAAQVEAAKNKDGWLRAQAELANARKRFEKQQKDAYNNATAAVIQKLLPALDDFDRAVENVPETIGEDSWFEGLLLVQRKLENILDNFNVQPIAALGEPFDPNLHEAIMQEESDEYESGVITRELQRGYKLGDRVIRPTLVYVAA